MKRLWTNWHRCRLLPHEQNCAAHGDDLKARDNLRNTDKTTEEQAVHTDWHKTCFSVQHESSLALYRTGYTALAPASGQLCQYDLSSTNTAFRQPQAPCTKWHQTARSNHYLIMYNNRYVRSTHGRSSSPPHGPFWAQRWVSTVA